MLDTRADSIIYQSQGYLVTLLDSLVTKKRVGKKNDHTWDTAERIVTYLEAWEERLKLADISQMNFILECLIDICKLNEFPAAPTILVTSPPAVLVGVKGDKGDIGNTGATGATGLATDFQKLMVSVSSVADSFNVTDAYGARWDYYVQESGGAQRVGSVIGTWNSDGSLIEMVDTSTADISSTTAALEFDVQVSGTTIQLVATISSGTWSIRGSRYFIPNNGNGAGPISDVLANGKIYIGSASGVATAQSVSGVIAITNSGVTSFVPGAIVNADINASADIEQSKILNLVSNLAAKLNLAGGTMSGIINMNSNKITNLTDGSASGDAINKSQLEAHEVLTNNPHQVTKAQVGLSNVDNTSDANKPVSTAQAAAIASAIAYDPGTWISMTLINSWTDDPAVGPCAYRKDSNGTVFLRGSCVNVGDVSTACFILPAGYRPTSALYLWGNGVKNDTTSHARMSIAATGNITLSSGQRMYLDNISFTTAI